MKVPCRPRWYIPLWLTLPGGTLCFILLNAVPRPPLTAMYYITIGLLALLLANRIFRAIAAVVAYRKAVKQISEDNYWVHLTYTAKEWQRFWQTSPDRHWSGYLIILVIIALFIGPMLFLVLLGSSTLTTPDALLATAIIILALGLTPFQEYLLWQQRLKQTPREIYINALGIYYGPNDFKALKNLDEITHDEEDATILQFVCRISRTLPRFGTATLPAITPVPIPHGYKQEVDLLMERFKQHKSTRNQDISSAHSS